MRPFALLAALLLPMTIASAARPTDAQKLEKALAGRTAGKAESCLSLPNIRSTTTYADPDTITYTTRSGVIYVNRPAGGCGSLRSDPIIVSQTPSTRICRGDIISLVDRASRFPVGGCGLGDFIPYPKPK